MKKEKKKQQTRLQKLAERLHDPLQFRIFVAGLVLLIGYVAIYTPLDARIVEISKSLKKAREYGKLANEVKQLKSEVTRVAARLPANTDTNEWVQYVLGGVRKFPVKLVSLEPSDIKSVGPFEAVVVQVEMRGYYDALESFLKWVETNERLFRIDAMSIAPAKGSDFLEMKLTLLGLRGG